MLIKRMLTTLLLLLLTMLAQKIKMNEYDKFIKQQRVESDPLPIASSPKMKLSVCLSAVGSNFYVQFIGAGVGANRIAPEDQVIFLMENDSTITVKSKGHQGFDIGTTTSTYKHSYILTYADLQKLSLHKLAALRKYHSEDYDDVNIPNEVSEQFKMLCALFIVELVKSNLLQIVESNVTAQATTGTAQTGSGIVQTADTLQKVKATFTTNTKADNPTKTKHEAVKAIAPAFPGGVEAWSAFLRRELDPPTTLDENEVREAFVQFLVTKDGSVRDVKLLQSAGDEFDREVLRVMKRTPKWQPAVENGRVVDATVTQRIIFVNKETK